MPSTVRPVCLANAPIGSSGVVSSASARISKKSLEAVAATGPILTWRRSVEDAMAERTGRTTTGAGEPSGATALLSVGGILGAIGASSCCLIPPALFTPGLIGPWIAGLPALAPPQPLIV